MVQQKNSPLTMFPFTLASDNNQTLYRDLFNEAPIGIVRTTVEGRLIEANLAFYQLLGSTAETDADCLGDFATNIYVHPKCREMLLAELRHKDSINHFPVLFRGKENRHINCHLHARARKNPDGTIGFIEGFIENVDIQIKTRQAIEKSEARYRSIFENTGAGTIIIEEDTTISMANSSFCKLFGFSKDEIEGRKKWPEIIADETQKKMMLDFHYRRRKNPAAVPLEYEFTLRDNYGRLRDIYLRVDVIGQSNSSVASLFDITAQKAACRQLSTSESKMAGIVEAFAGHIYTRTREYRLTYMNKALQDQIGAEAIGQLCHKILYRQDSPCPWCPRDLVFEGAAIKSELQHPHNGHWFYTVSSSIFDVNKGETESQTVLIDIHERKQAELKLKEKELFLEQENVRLKAAIKERYRFGSIIGKSKEMQTVYEKLLRAAASDASVIIYGESGTGKELVAKAIHDLSKQADHTFLPVNCGAVPAELMESEFFGYVKGAFTGADRDKQGYFDLAAGGTLFLDELGEISEKLQVKLLRALEGGGYTPIGGVGRRETNVRIIGATNRNLGTLIDQGKMREDFFYRVHILPIHLPPLRNRGEDIPLLIEHFLKKYQHDTTRTILPGRDIDRLMRHSWPGNIRELENTIQRYVNLGYLELSSGRQLHQPAATGDGSASKVLPLNRAVQDFEKDYIVKLLTHNQWNRTRVASLLGIERKTLYLKLKKFGIQNRKTN